MHDPILLLTSKVCGILEKNIVLNLLNFLILFRESLILKDQLINVDKRSKKKIIVSGKPSAENIFRLFNNIEQKKKFIDI